MATAGPARGLIHSLGDQAYQAIAALGDFTLFTAQTLSWTVRRRPAPRTLIASFYQVGVRSVPVVAATGMFIGVIMAVQLYNQFHKMGLATRLGAIINVTLVRELGPVLAATMLAGRVGCAMAAELATMRITEQVDALTCLGAPPIHYLVVPRFLAATLLIPLLTILADFMGVMGGGYFCTRFYGIEPHFYWEHTQGFVTLWDMASGCIKATFFGAAIALISCHRGLNSEAGAEGVGRAATETFVVSFVVILVLDFFLGLLLINVYDIFMASGAGQSLLR
jgi:phospholipid/cholesterol/gamma-HCH transport system permease protein